MRTVVLHADADLILDVGLATAVPLNVAAVRTIPEGGIAYGAMSLRITGLWMEIFNLPFWVFVAVIAGIYTIFALGLYLQYALAGLPNFGHVAFAALAAYTMSILIIHLNIPMWIAALAGLLAAVIFSLVLGIPSLRLRADYLAIATIAGGEIVRYLALNMQGLTGGPIGSIGMLGPSQLAQYNQSWDALLRPIVDALKQNSVLAPAASRDFAMLLIVWAVAIILLLIFWLMVRSPWGRMMRAIREDEEAAAAVGKNVFRAKMQVLILGALLGGLAGLFLAWQIGIITPDDYQPTFTFYAYLILILGGTTRIWAIPVGALLFGLLYSGTRFLNFYPLSLIDSGDRAYLRLILVGLLLIVLMAIRPQGLFGNRRELLLR
jgi:branched-chain amino acid transport system permease protein